MKKVKTIYAISFLYKNLETNLSIISFALYITLAIKIQDQSTTRQEKADRFIEVFIDFINGVNL